MSEDDFTSVVDANLTGAYRVAKRAAQGMLRARRGRIIFMSSVVGLLGSAGQANYAASKAGLVGLARSLARELGVAQHHRQRRRARARSTTDMTAALGDERHAPSSTAAVPLGRFGHPRRGRRRRRASWPPRRRLHHRRRHPRRRRPRHGPLTHLDVPSQATRVTPTSNRTRSIPWIEELFERFRKCAVEVLSVPSRQGRCPRPVRRRPRRRQPRPRRAGDGARGGVRHHGRTRTSSRASRPSARPRPGRRQALMDGARAGASPSPASAWSRRAASGTTRSGTGLLGPAITERRAPASTDCDPTPYFDNPKEARRADRFAAVRRWPPPPRRSTQAGELDGRSRPRRRRSSAPASAACTRSRSRSRVLLEKGERRVSPFLVPMMMANAGGAAISMRYGCRARARRSCTACAAGTHAIGNAARLIAWGRCDAVVTGGTEAAHDARSASPGSAT